MNRARADFGGLHASERARVGQPVKRLRSFQLAIPPDAHSVSEDLKGVD